MFRCECAEELAAEDEQSPIWICALCLVVLWQAHQCMCSVGVSLLLTGHQLEHAGVRRVCHTVCVFEVDSLQHAKATVCKHIGTKATSDDVLHHCVTVLTIQPASKLSTQGTAVHCSQHTVL
jgi:hypothetical protein